MITVINNLYPLIIAFYLATVNKNCQRLKHTYHSNARFQKSEKQPLQAKVRRKNLGSFAERRIFCIFPVILLSYSKAVPDFAHNPGTALPYILYKFPYKFNLRFYYG